jgi:mannose/fructose-specific phosphotransferase system component IIA
MPAEPERVGVLLIAHGGSATPLLEAARGIAGSDAFEDVEVLDAGAGRTEALDRAVEGALARLDHGRGVVVITDLFGASPCNCSRQELGYHENGVLISGLNLAMLCKLAYLDRRRLGALELANQIADAGRKSVTVHQTPSPESKQAPAAPPKPTGSEG